MFENLMRSQACKNPPAPIERKESSVRNRKLDVPERASPLNKVVKTTRLKGNPSPKSKIIAGQRSIKSFLEQNKMEQRALVFRNSGVCNIRDQRSNVLCNAASDLKTIEASKVMDCTAHQLQKTATEGKLNI